MNQAHNSTGFIAWLMLFAYAIAAIIIATYTIRERRRKVRNSKTRPGGTR